MLLLHSGQTGVERGVHRAALAVGFAVGGKCSHERRDEFGALPASVSDVLSPCEQRGTRRAVLATLDLANALVLVVPDAASVAVNPGIPAYAREARMRKLPVHVVDPTTPLAPIVSEVARSDTRLLITGPRSTRWPTGERTAWQIVLALADACLPGPRWIPA